MPKSTKELELKKINKFERNQGWIEYFGLKISHEAKLMNEKFGTRKDPRVLRKKIKQEKELL